MSPTMSDMDAVPWEPTGLPRVDEVLAGLDRVAGLPLTDQAAAYEEAHRTLRAALDDTSAEPTADGSGDDARAASSG